MISDEDFYGGRAGPLEIFFLMITGPVRKILFIYLFFLMISNDFYGGRTGPLEKFYLFFFFF